MNRKLRHAVDEFDDSFSLGHRNSATPPITFPDDDLISDADVGRMTVTRPRMSTYGLSSPSTFGFSTKKGRLMIDDTQHSEEARSLSQGKSPLSTTGSRTSLSNQRRRTSVAHSAPSSPRVTHQQHSPSQSPKSPITMRSASPLPQKQEPARTFQWSLSLSSQDTLQGTKGEEGASTRVVWCSAPDTQSLAKDLTIEECKSLQRELKGLLTLLKERAGSAVSSSRYSSSGNSTTTTTTTTMTTDSDEEVEEDSSSSCSSSDDSWDDRPRRRKRKAPPPKPKKSNAESNTNTSTLKQMSVPEIKERLRELKLPLSGTKQVLLQRLEAYEVQQRLKQQLDAAHAVAPPSPRRVSTQQHRVSGQQQQRPSARSHTSEVHLEEAAASPRLSQSQSRRLSAVHQAEQDLSMHRPSRKRQRSHSPVTLSDNKTKEREGPMEEYANESEGEDHRESDGGRSSFGSTVFARVRNTVQNIFSSMRSSQASPTSTSRRHSM